MTNLMIRPERNLDKMIDEMFGDFVSFPRLHNGTAFSPRVDVVESDDNLALTFEVPGIEKSDIKVMVRDNTLTVSGERNITVDREKERFVHRELVTGSFSRSFSLPESIDSEKINADYKNGILRISLPKVEAARPKEIEVSVN